MLGVTPKIFQMTPSLYFVCSQFPNNEVNKYFSPDMEPNPL